MRTISIAALNIVLPGPHHPNKYGAFWSDAAKRRSPVKVRGDTGGMIGSAQNGPGGEYIWGDLFKFVNIDLAGPWLDIATREAAPPEDVGRKVVIPETYRPNLRALPYVFFPSSHRLFFISSLDLKHKLSPGMAKRMIEEILLAPALVAEFGAVTVTVEPDRETLRKIFALPVLKKISMVVSPPNALGDVERELLRYMAEQHATKYTQELTSNHPQGLELTPHTMQVAKAAQSNGYVSASGVNDEGITVKLSTVDHPQEEKVLYNTNVTTPSDVLHETAKEMLIDILGREPAGG